MPFVAHATVGGDSTISDLVYNNKDESVYYTVIDESGRGCPDMVDRISLVDNTVRNVFTCDQGENIINTMGTEGFGEVSKRVINIKKGMKLLTPISLSKNVIQIDVEHIKEVPSKFDDFETNHLFEITVYQNEKQVLSASVVGCEKDQSFSFTGYAIPGFEKKMILFQSTKTDCYEVGYIQERLHVVGGVDIKDRQLSQKIITIKQADSSDVVGKKSFLVRWIGGLRDLFRK
jgi:hypothetical protein